LLPLLSYSQHNNESQHESMKGSHRIALGIGHTNIAEGLKNGEKQWIVMPSWAVNYDYWLSDKWAAGLQFDLILETFVIEHNGEEDIERDKPYSFTPVALFKPWKHITFTGGFGIEFSEEKDIPFTRLGVEYGWHLPNNWELGGELLWDNKLNYYNSWSIVLSVAKIIRSKKNETHNVVE
jgi:hypothetical protein